MEKLFKQFEREKQYLSNLSPKTIKYYKRMFHLWNQHIGELLTKQNVKEFVIKLTESDLSPFTINSYIQGINAILTWLYENDHI